MPGAISSLFYYNMSDEGEDDLNRILGGEDYDIDEETESPSHLDDEREKINMGVGRAPPTVDAVGTIGLATNEGRIWELREEGPCQAPSLAYSTMNRAINPLMSRRANRLFAQWPNSVHEPIQF